MTLRAWFRTAAMDYAKTRRYQTRIHRFREMRALATILIALMPSAAVANWQYTEFGMSPEQVIEASGGKAAKPADPIGYPPAANKRHLLSAAYSVGDIKFDAKFNFDGADKLVSVVLYPRDPDKCIDIIFAMKETYGPPEQVSDDYSIFFRWKDERNKNDIVIQSFVKTLCKIEYKELGAKRIDGF